MAYNLLHSFSPFSLLSPGHRELNRQFLGADKLQFQVLPNVFFVSLFSVDLIGRTEFRCWVLSFFFFFFLQVVYHLYSSIVLCNSDAQPLRMHSPDSSPKFRQNNHAFTPRKISCSPNCLPSSACDRSRCAVLDAVIMIAVIAAFGFLLFPSFKFLVLGSIKILGAILYLVGEEVSQAPLIYASIGLSTLCASLAAWGVLACTPRKCGNPNCKGLRKAAEFDIQLEIDESGRNSRPLTRDGDNKELLELPLVCHRELEAELKKIAPSNGKAVLVFRARCGCSVGRLEVPGPKKQQRKNKK